MNFDINLLKDIYFPRTYTSGSIDCVSIPELFVTKIKLPNGKILEFNKKFPECKEIDYPKRVYLAGPDVFYPKAEERGKRLKEICEQYGLEGVFPLDPIAKTRGLKLSQPYQIFEDCKFHIDTCDGVIANITPFRGVSCDVGTAVEIGYALASDKPVFGYTLNSNTYFDRVQESMGVAYRDSMDENMNEIENFGLEDNLMVICGMKCVIQPFGFCVNPFERCVNFAANYLK